jgi:carbamate kinase
MAGPFPKGTRVPKIEAAIFLLEIGGKKTTICSVEGTNHAAAGNSGTPIT